jgi:hypothetical protein
MKITKSSSKRFSTLTLQLGSWGSYLKEARKIENLLRKKPARLRIELIGSGEMPSDTALLIRSILLARSSRTRIITQARSSLQGAAVLVWLLGDHRLIRDDARLYFRAAGPFEDGDGGTSWNASDPLDDDLESADYIRVLQRINEFLPVRELAGHAIELPTLRQFGLVDSERTDVVLNALLSRKRPSKAPTAPEPVTKRPCHSARQPGIRSAERPPLG